MINVLRLNAHWGQDEFYKNKSYDICILYGLICLLVNYGNGCIMCHSRVIFYTPELGTYTKGAIPCAVEKVLWKTHWLIITHRWNMKRVNTMFIQYILLYTSKGYFIQKISNSVMLFLIHALIQYFTYQYSEMAWASQLPRPIIPSVISFPNSSAIYALSTETMCILSTISTLPLLYLTCLPY